jgi:signal transduction histidine kinase/CheY-like chemotaxis protein
LKIVALLLGVVYLAYQLFKNRRLCKFYLQSKRRILNKKSSSSSVRFFSDIRKDLLREPLYSFCDIIHANSTCYVCIQSSNSISFSISNVNVNEISIKGIYKRLIASDENMIIEDILVDRTNNKVLAHKVIVDGFVIGIVCFFFNENKIFSNTEFQFIRSFIELVKLVEKSDIIEDALGKCESDLETMMNFINEGVIVIDKDFKIRRMNMIAQGMTKITEEKALNKLLTEVLVLEDLNLENLLEKVIKKDFATELDLNSNLKTVDSKIFVSVRIAQIFGSDSIDGIALFIRNLEKEKIIEQERERRCKEKEKHYLELQSEVQQRKEIEEALTKSAAMASAGTLTTGIVHEYNNINSIVMGNLDLLLKMQGVSPTILSSLKTVREMILRSSDLTRNLLDYARETTNSDGNKKWLSLFDIVDNTKNLVKKEFSSEGIVFTSNFDSIEVKDKKDFDIFVDESQIKQSILNIILNARHAMIASKKKVVSFNIYNHQDNIELQVKDSGHGIPKEDLEKLFDPFFSTKGDFAKEESQKQFSGNGLGLSMCNLFMKKNNGYIDVESKPGKGTIFKFIFNKLSKERIDTDLLKVEEKEETEILDGTGKRVILLDDEEELCKLLSRVFRNFNYDVFTTDDGSEALQKINDEKYDLIITDIQMPKMTGTEFLNNLSTINNKNIKVVVLTGRTKKEDLKDYDFDEFVCKPFDVYKLMEKVQNLLEI